MADEKSGEAKEIAEALFDKKDKSEAKKDDMKKENDQKKEK